LRFVTAPALRVQLPPQVYRGRRAGTIRSRCDLGVEPTFWDDGQKDQAPAALLPIRPGGAAVTPKRVAEIAQHDPTVEPERRYPGYCSFCRKSYRDVGPLAEGSDLVLICYGCITLCAAIIQNECKRLGIKPGEGYPSGPGPGCNETRPRET
jgi:hypothetical protein